MLNYCIVLLIAFTTQRASTQRTCREFGAIQLLSDHISSEGRVEFCDGSHWGRVCGQSWDHYDAAVVCRELGYTANGALYLQYIYNYRNGPGNNIIDVNCHSSEPRLRDCTYSNYSDYCPSHEYAGVRCRAFKTIYVTIPYNTMHSVMVIWEYHLRSSTSYQLTSFEVECFSQQHSTWFSVNKETFKIIVDGLLPFTSYNCCVSAILYHYYYHWRYTREKQCSSTLIETMNFTSAAPAEMQLINNDSSMRANIIGGVLGFIIIILVLLLVICAGALLYLLQSRTSGVISKRSPQPQGANTMGMCIDRNISYVAALSHSTTSGSQATQATRAAGDQGGTGAAAEYSRIGPSYATTDNNSRGQQPVAGSNRVSARLSERYEFSEAHLAMASGGGGGGGQGETPMEYEVPLQSGEHEEYSHLQH